MGTILLWRCPTCGVSRATDERAVSRCTGSPGGKDHWPTEMVSVGSMEADDDMLDGDTAQEEPVNLGDGYA